MKIAFVGKGGSGKTTLASLFSRYLATQSQTVLAFDADINQHLATALGMTPSEAATLPALGLDMNRIKHYLRGSNKRIASDRAMIKTTPPGRGSRLIAPSEPNPLWAHFGRMINGVRLMVTGPLSETDLGVACYHSKVGAVELMLSHMIDGAQDYVIVDMTAGADSFASGLFTKFDLTFLVAEPTLRGASVYEQYSHYARDYGVELRVIGNKIEDEDDVRFLRDHVGDALIATIGRSAYVKGMEKGQHAPLEALEPANRAVLEQMKTLVDEVPQDWATFYRHTLEFHDKNALSWANEEVGEDLHHQIDPDFHLETMVG